MNKKPLWDIEKIVKSGEYLFAVVRGHPNAYEHDYVLAHRVVMENKLGRLLKGDEVVHHKDGNKHNNHPNNLLLESRSVHTSRHLREKGQSWVTLKCPQCGKLFDRERRTTQLTQKTKHYTACSLECSGGFTKGVRKNGWSEKQKKAIEENIVREYKVYT